MWGHAEGILAGKQIKIFGRALLRNQMDIRDKRAVRSGTTSERAGSKEGTLI